MFVSFLSYFSLFPNSYVKLITYIRTHKGTFKFKICNVLTINATSKKSNVYFWANREPIELDPEKITYKKKSKKKAQNYNKERRSFPTSDPLCDHFCTKGN